MMSAPLITAPVAAVCRPACFGGLLQLPLHTCLNNQVSPREATFLASHAETERERRRELEEQIENRLAVDTQSR